MYRYFTSLKGTDDASIGDIYSFNQCLILVFSDFLSFSFIVHICVSGTMIERQKPAANAHNFRTGLYLFTHIKNILLQTLH